MRHLREGEIVCIKGTCWVVMYKDGNVITMQCTDRPYKGKKITGYEDEIVPMLDNPPKPRHLYEGDILYTNHGTWMVIGISKREHRRMVHVQNTETRVISTGDERDVLALTKEIDRENPPHQVELYDQLLEIRAKKGKNSLWPKERFRHSFKAKSKARVLGNPDGSLTIRSSTGKPLWKMFDY